MISVPKICLRAFAYRIGKDIQMSWNRTKKVKRTPAQVREHYEIEKRLGNLLRNSSETERSFLYTSVYNELFRLVPHHPQLTRKTDPNAQSERVDLQFRLLKRFLNPQITFLELGSGDCSLALKVAKYVDKVYALDVSHTITESSRLADNLEIIIYDGYNIPVPKSSVDLVYSRQVIEHLHPDDVLKQTQSIYDILKYQGQYICLTANRLNGPHDISRSFDKVATGLHIKEYTVSEMTKTFKAIGFSNISAFIGPRGVGFLSPVKPIEYLERFIDKIRLPTKFKVLLGIKIVARK